MTANLPNVELAVHVWWRILSHVAVLTKFDEVRHRALHVFHDGRKMSVGNVFLLAELSTCKLIKYKLVS